MNSLDKVIIDQLIIENGLEKAISKSTLKNTYALMFDRYFKNETQENISIMKMLYSIMFNIEQKIDSVKLYEELIDYQNNNTNSYYLIIWTLIRMKDINVSYFLETILKTDIDIKELIKTLLDLTLPIKDCGNLNIIIKHDKLYNHVICYDLMVHYLMQRNGKLLKKLDGVVLDDIFKTLKDDEIEFLINQTIWCSNSFELYVNICYRANIKPKAEMFYYITMLYGWWIGNKYRTNFELICDRHNLEY